MSERVRQPGIWFVVGVLIALIIAVLVVGLLTRTDRGRAEVLAYTVAALGGQLNGTLVIERLEGNLLTGAQLYGLSLHDEQDRLLMRSDSAYIEYDAPTLIGGDIVINDLVLYRPEFFLHRAPGDTLWNYQAVLRDTTAEDPERAARVTLIERLSVVDAQITVRDEWEPDEDLPPEERRREIEAALSDTSRVVVEEVPGGYLRTMFFDVAAGTLADLLIGPDERGGTYLRVRDARGTIHLWRYPPMHLADLEGELGLRNGIVRYVAERAVVGDSEITSGGTIDLTGEEPRYDLVFAGERIAFADLQWLYPSLPESGDLTARMWLETRPEGLYILVRDGTLRAPDTRIAGDVGIVFGDTILFTDVDLHAEPLNVETVRQMLPGDVPVRGLRIGSVVIESPDA